MAYRPSSSAPSASMSRSKTSQNDIQSLADSMLRSSLSGIGSASSASSVSTARRSSYGVHHPSTEQSSAASTSSNLARGLNSLIGSLSSGRERSSADNRPPNVLSKSNSATASLTGGQRRATEFDGKAEQARTSESQRHTEMKRKLVKQPQRADSAASSSPSRVSAAEAKQRVRQLQREVDRASAATPQRTTAGLFKAVCSTDLLFLIDTTFSMAGYINAAKEQVRSIMSDIKEAFLNEAEVRIAVVGYKDHRDTLNIQFLDFTRSADRVRQFLNQLEATGGGDKPEDVLGGVRQAINASWYYQSRCIVHIADSPPHGRTLHDLRDDLDDYIKPGSEPHGLLYESLLRQLVQLKINYCLLHIESSTDRMAFVFSRSYAAARADVKLLPSNTYCIQVSSEHTRASSATWTSAGLQFEELELGTTYGALRHLVLKTATSSASRAANRLSSSLNRGGKTGAISRRGRQPAPDLASIEEDEDAGDVPLEKVPPKWDTPGWLDETLVVEGFCPDTVVHRGSTLNNMMALDENIKLSIAELTIYARSKPFAQGALRTSSYARTAASTNRFVVKSFKKSSKGIAHLAEDLRCQALCKAFALEFNALLGAEHSIDFIVTACLQGKSGTSSADKCISLEPFIEGKYVKYNSNGGYVNEGAVNLTKQRRHSRILRSSDRVGAS
ncbi:hypothetical protein F5Y06DRAFT_274734 [Hypoxylon sp. FL0890]|nr:hypothetical protein F5Y06DRAFT_274734 [Hypoxylon sp. FL0890]